MNEATLLKGLLDTDKVDDVRELIDRYVETQSKWVSWRPVGDRANNSGTIQVAGDPARALFERVTNGIDAVIDRAHQEHGGKPKCSTPKEAVQAWFGVPVAGMHKLSDAGRRKLAQESVRLILLPGDGRAKRAVEIADAGTGLTADQMPNTILSLNASNKLDKFYLAGAFGQGGSATFAISDYTLIASRSVKAPDTVAFTIVKYLPPEGMKLGSYVYLVREGGVLATSEIPENFGAFSTRVRHYGYDLDDYPSPLGPNSVYGRAQGILFEPVLPFWFENRVHEYSRTIKGSRTALNGARDEGEEESKLSHSSPLFYADLGEYGQLGIEYWVLEPSAKSAPNRSFVNGSKPIVLTVNGQTHAEWNASLLRKDAELLHLAARMVVHLDCNQLSTDAKRVLFVSTREESRKGLVQNLIAQELLSALKADDRLAELEQQARLAGAKERDESAEREIKKEVARMLKLFGFSVAEDFGATKSKVSEDPGPSTPRKSRPKPEPIHVNEPPTFVEFVGEEPVGFYPGQRRYMRVRTDAHSKYHDAADQTKSRFSFIVDGDKVRVAGSTALRDGHMRVIFAADSDASIGTSGKLVAELRPLNAPTLSSSLGYTIVPAPPAKPGGAKINLPKIDCLPIDSKESEEWVSWGWPDDVAEVAADYEFASDTLTIRYSTLFPRYRAALDQLTLRDAVLGESFKRRFEIWLITSVLIHWQDTGSDATKLSEAELEEEELENFKRDEIRRMAKAVIVYAQREVTQGVARTEEPE